MLYDMLYDILTMSTSLRHFYLFAECQKVEDRQIIDHLSNNKEDLAPTIC